MSADYLPRREEALDVWATNFSAVIAGAPAAFGLTIQESDTLAGFVTTFSTRLQAALDPSTRTPVSISQKNAAKEALLGEVRPLVQRIQYFPGLSDDQRVALGITVPDPTPTPVPVPATKPILVLRGNSGCTHSVRLVDETTPTRRGKPQFVDGVDLYSYVSTNGDAPPADLREWNYEGHFTRTELQVRYAPETAGKTAYLRANWFNDRGQTGPVSEPISGTIAA